MPYLTLEAFVSARVATAGATGLITAVAHGSATITATVEGKSASLPVTVVEVVSIPAFQRPFAGDFLMSNFMDHDVPFEFVDDNGGFTTFWGGVHAKTDPMIDGHSGYDWTMPTGKPVLAVAAGTVTSAATYNVPFFCSLLNRDVSDMISVAVASQDSQPYRSRNELRDHALHGAFIGDLEQPHDALR